MPRVPMLMALFALTTGGSAIAQRPVGDPDPGRKASTVIVLSKTHAAEAAVSVSFSQPVWRDSYDALRKQLTGPYTRLGNGWWTTLDTIGVIDLGGVRIQPGSYFVGLSRAADDSFSLLLFDSRKAMQARLRPSTTALYRGEVKAEFTVPLTFTPGGLAASVPRLEVELVTGPADAAVGRLSIRWGKHELAAPMRLERTVPADGIDGKK